MTWVTARSSESVAGRTHGAAFIARHSARRIGESRTRMRAAGQALRRLLLAGQLGPVGTVDVARHTGARR